MEPGLESLTPHCNNCVKRGDYLADNDGPRRRMGDGQVDNALTVSFDDQGVDLQIGWSRGDSNP